MALGAIDSIATDESELLAKFASDPANLIPDMVFISTATLTVSFGSKGGLSTQSISNVETILEVPTIGIASLEDTEKLGINPLYDLSSDEENYGFLELTGDKHYLDSATNQTDAEYSQLDITSDYSVESYHYLVLEKLETLDQTTTSSIIVSFGNSLSANISSSSETYNATIASGIIYPIATTLWFNLVCHTNETFPYVLNTEVKNVKIAGYEVFQFDDDKFVSDSRYNVAYIDADENELSGNSDIAVGKLIALSGTTNCDMSIQAATLDELNTTKMLSSVSTIDTKQDMYVVARGWKTGDELEDDLKAIWRQQLGLDEDDKITDYALTKGYFQNIINRGTVKLIQNELRYQLDSQTDYNALMNNVRKKYLPVCAITNSKKAFDTLGTSKSISSDTFWDTIKTGITNVANTITSVAKNIFDAPAKTIDALGDAAGKVVTPVAQTVQTAVQTVGENIAPAVTNMISDSVGHVTEGVVGVAGAAKDLGSNIMDSLKWPLMIGLPIIGVALIGVAIWYFGIKPKKAQ